MPTARIFDKSGLKTVLLVPLIIILFCFLMNFSASAINLEGIRNGLWDSGGNVSASSDDVLSANAMAFYIEKGVFGDNCKLSLLSLSAAEKQDKMTSPDKIISISGCEKARSYYQSAATYASFAAGRMSNFDKTGVRLDAALERASNLFHDVMAILLGFGFLTSILVFTILFLRLAWLPTHEIQRRSLFEDIIMAGVGTMMLGNIWVIISLFQSSFNRFWQTFAVYSKDWRTVANMILVEYQGFIVGISGIATLVVLAMFVVNFALLSLNGANVQKRSTRISALIQCAIATAGLGSVTLICGFFWSMLS